MNYTTKKGGVIMSRFWRIIDLINEVLRALYNVFKGKNNNGNGNGNVAIV